STQDSRDFIGANIPPQSRAAHPPEPCYGTRAVHELVGDLDARMRSARINRVIGNVTFILEDARDLGLDLRVRDQHLQFLRTRPIADTRQKIGNWISNSTHEIRRLARRDSLPDR